jgi:hypothetical protein
VDVRDKIILPTNENLRDIEIVSENVLKHHKNFVWQETQGNQTITYTIKLVGFVIDGKTVPAKYVYLGGFSENLRPFVSFEFDNPALNYIDKGTLKIGYEDINFNTVIPLATIRGFNQYQFRDLVMQKDFSDFLGPFTDNIAAVKVNTLTTERPSGFFTPWDFSLYCETRLIDNTGAQIDDNALRNDRRNAVGIAGGNSEQAKPEAEDLEKKAIRKLREKGYEPYAFCQTRKSCVRFAPNMWVITDSKGKLKTVFSPLESKGNFSCGLIKIKKKGLFGFADKDAEIIIEPAYKEPVQFENNITFVRKDKQWYFIKRSCSMEFVSDFAPPTAGGGEKNILESYREGLQYLNDCEAFTEENLREFNRIIGNRFTEELIAKYLSDAKMLVGGMEDLKKIMKDNITEGIAVFEEVERQGIDLSAYAGKI